MAINVADNFSYKGAKPLDARTKFVTIADMVATPVADLYDGCEAYVTANKKYYSFDSSNTVDETLGKWRERESGGGHTIEDSEGTSLTQRDTMQFGDGFNATDDSENEKTVVEPNFMTTADMDDVVTPLPSVRSGYHKYSTEEQIVGEWIDGRPIYEKVYIGTTPTVTTEGVVALQTISLGDISLRDVVDMRGLMISKTGTISYQMINMTYMTETAKLFIQAYVNKTDNTIVIKTNTLTFNDRDLVFIIQYTKAD